LKPDARAYVAGHRGLVGSAIVRALRARGQVDVLTRTHAELDLTRQADVERFFARERPRFVILAAARVGGIVANDTYSGEFIRDNLLIQTNVIDSAWRNSVEKLCVLGSSCIYPKLAPQPIKEDYLLTGPLESTNAAYAIAKIAGVEMARSYRKQYGMRCICPMPTNLYGPDDNFDLEKSHVLPALLRKFHEAKRGGAPRVIVWGTGTPKREFLHVDDLADAVLFLMEHYDEPDPVNVGVGVDISIRDLALLIQRIVGYTGELVFDASKPDGTPRKLLDVSKIKALGWHARISLEEGIRRTYEWYRTASA
jgi:GDP-L-fucose synthase